jgi:hypothetical protein
MSKDMGDLPALAEAEPVARLGPLGFDPGRRPPALMMGNVMLVGEEELGRKGVWPHHKRLPKWFIPGDWSVWPVLAYDKRELHIVAISSARKGAFRRLVDGARKAGLTPVVVSPFGQMTAIMRKWGWRKTVIGEGWDEREEWRPASAIEAATAAKTPQSDLAVGESAVPEGETPR